MNYRLLFLASITTFSLSAMCPDKDGLVTINGQKHYLFEYLLRTSEEEKKNIDVFCYDTTQGSTLAKRCVATVIPDTLSDQELTALSENNFIFAPNYSKQRCAIIIGTTDTSVASKVKK